MDDEFNFCNAQCSFLKNCSFFSSSILIVTLFIFLLLLERSAVFILCCFCKKFELKVKFLTHRVISDRVHRLLVTLSYFRPDRFVQLLSLIPILILLLYFLVSGCLTSLC